MDGLGRAMQAFFASIPHQWYTKNEIARYEGYYASIVYIIEFKVLELNESGRALEQIKTMGYAQKYGGQETYLIGVEFSKETKNIERFEWERAER